MKSMILGRGTWFPSFIFLNKRLQTFDPTVNFQLDNLHVYCFKYFAKRSGKFSVLKLQ